MADDDMIETGERAQRATMQRLRRMFTAAGVGGYGPDEGPGMQCAFCPDGASEFIHVTRRINFLGNDNYDATGQYGLAVRSGSTVWTCAATPLATPSSCSRPSTPSPPTATSRCSCLS
jgi:hypothetical protein